MHLHIVGCFLYCAELSGFNRGPLRNCCVRIGCQFRSNQLSDSLTGKQQLLWKALCVRDIQLSVSTSCYSIPKCRIKSSSVAIWDTFRGVIVYSFHRHNDHELCNHICFKHLDFSDNSYYHLICCWACTIWRAPWQLTLMRQHCADLYNETSDTILDFTAF